MSGPRLVLRGRLLDPRDRGAATVVVEDGLVVEVAAHLRRTSGAAVYGDSLHTLVPGFVDLQVNGFAGRDAAEGVDAMVEMARRLPATGVTAFLPTAITAPPERLAAFIAATAQAAARTGPGSARILGAHVEGPFLAAAHAGAHDPSLMRDPSPAELDRLLAHGPPALVTLAPERDHALAAIRRLVAAGVAVSAGHSAAGVETARAAFRAGVSFGTHLFNAMSGVHHREPGLAAALLADPRVTTGLIADGVHVHEAVLALAIRAKGPGRIALTTDQTAAAGMPPGRFRLGDRDVVSDGRTVRLEDGTLAGSAATMDTLVALVSGLPGAGIASAVRMASATPARVLGAGDRLGSIAAGRPADLVVFGPSGEIALTVAGGRVAFQAV